MPRVARLLVAFGVCSVDAGTPAEPPGSIGIIEPSEENFTISWSPGLANDCVFQAWQVRVRSRNLNGTLVGSWRDPACQVPTTREEPNCTVTGLQSNSPYDVQIFELCSSSSDDSSAGEPEEVLWTLPGYWDIHVPPHDSSIYVVEDTMEAHAGCEIIKSCCGDQFSLCFSGNESRTVEIQRVDTELGWEKQVGWGQDLYLRCHAPSVAPFKSDPLPQAQAEEPHYLRLHTSTHVTAQVVFHHGTFIGGCQCASHRLQTRPEGSSTWRTEGGDCLVPDLRGCSVQDLVPNARIYSRLQTTCLDESMNSNWSQTVDVITRPGCTWTFDSSIQGADVNQLECVDKTFCDIADETCCQSHGGRLRCPGNFSVMCENQDCVGGTDYCCVSSDVECDSHGGVRFCSPSMVPAEVPAFRDFNSYLASSLRIEWRRGVYLSEDDSPCGFQTWQIEVVVLLTLCCSGTMGAIYCFCWSKGTSVVPQSPLALPSSPPHQKSGESLKSPTGGISPAAVSDLRSAAVEHTAQEEAEIPLRKEMLRPASVQVRVVNSGGATSPGKAEVRVEGSVRPARSATVASSRSPLSHAPRPASPSEPRVALTARSTKSEPHRLPLEPRPGQP